MGSKKKDTRPIATLDIETDPFLYGNTPSPFAIGFYANDSYVDFWGDDCIVQMMNYLASLDDDYIIYVHNGGGFDFWYMQKWITNPLFFIKSKIAKCGLLGRHELRDSYKMIPVPLAAYQKESIDYQKFWYPTRERPEIKEEIRYYLQKDCEYLFKLVMEFIDNFGMHLTIGAAAIKQLKSFYPQKHENETYDARFRPWYMGGRNQCFKKGEIKGDFKIYDVNSMYPYVMKAYRHPKGGSFAATKKLHENKVSFLRINAVSNGALPIFDKGLKFPHGTNDFWACSHEIIAGIELGILRINKIYEGYYFNETQDFSEYIDKFAAMKEKADIDGDQGMRLFAKLLMNNGYGKFGQDPRNYKDCEIFEDVDELIEAGYKVSTIIGDRYVGEKPAQLQDWSFNNVAVAASITSGSRAELMRGIAAASNPVYCDTDSIICESLRMPLHDSRLGAWKTEAEADTMYIAGKKLYAAYKDGSPVTIKGKEKKACKGVNMSASTIREVCLGAEVQIPIDAPNLRFGQPAKFISRKISCTA